MTNDNQSASTLVASDNDLLAQAKLLLDEYIKVSQSLIDRGIFINLGIDNGFQTGTARLHMMQGVKSIVRPPEPPARQQ